MLLVKILRQRCILLSLKGFEESLMKHAWEKERIPGGSEFLEGSQARGGISAVQPVSRVALGNSLVFSELQFSHRRKWDIKHAAEASWTVVNVE